jgi:hypothetical protein
MVAANGTIIETCKDIDVQIPDVVKAFINSDDICTDIVADACQAVIQRHLAEAVVCSYLITVCGITLNAHMIVCCIDQPLQLSRIDKEFVTIFAA